MSDTHDRAAKEKFHAENILPPNPSRLVKEPWEDVLDGWEGLDLEEGEHYNPHDPYQQLPEAYRLLHTVKRHERVGLYTDGEEYRKKRLNGQIYKPVIQVLNPNSDVFNQTQIQIDYHNSPRETATFGNRMTFYQILQERGMVVMDDTGVSLRGSAQTDTVLVIFMPQELDCTKLFALEDKVRFTYPFDSIELIINDLQKQTGGHAHDLPEEAVNAADIRALIETLAQEEEFLPLFDASDRLAAERREHRKKAISMGHGPLKVSYPELPEL